ncbi:ribonuclease H-like domain-containing protein [Clostridium guangxiense]|uniref:ribonuclease H-like domain-containing protein n=1 Tax=Clostridium sp. DMHC 10 TaxID=747377 RepID=UPI001E40C74D|nr:ribonuclease H-like domain-containing protein [Clostridium sp. DMHC 10]MCD2346458.1 ribonuclease H-like domain-containing protein [Clostridium guangxiense]
MHVNGINNKECLEKNGNNEIYKKALFFDLEHYIYKKPVCIGVFGCAYYDEALRKIKITQYMIENKSDALRILDLAKEYFYKAKNELDKEYIVTFSGNNDFTIINYLFEKNNINIKVNEYFESIDLQKEYEKIAGKVIGLKNLEKIFNISRESELISGATLAKTFYRVIKDDDYFSRMPDEKKTKILRYNGQDVISLFYMLISWSRYAHKLGE